ncbi:TIR domain-containing protein [Parasediminibacterium sp. JCM 36343]|uniref:TIR domain-containing protein n=1 Tax=Parasediminibacterium sp. JCM 36343 TaxID=3374279 RepID=UPI00397A4AF0
MARRVFFSFDYQDIIEFRGNVVRNHTLTKDNYAGCFDASIWEEAKKTSEVALKRLINRCLKNTSVTCVLVGSDTYDRRWVYYEIMKSLKKGNHLLAIHINTIKGKDGKTKPKGRNPFYYLGYSFDKKGKKLNLHYLDADKWVKYPDLAGWHVRQVEEKDRDKIFRLSDICPIYDWVEDGGYEHFSAWVETPVKKNVLPVRDRKKKII